MSVEKGEKYKCEVCGNVVEVIEGSYGDLVCCEQKMKLIEEESKEE